MRKLERSREDGKLCRRRNKYELICGNYKFKEIFTENVLPALRQKWFFISEAAWNALSYKEQEASETFRKNEERVATGFMSMVSSIELKIIH